MSALDVAAMPARIEAWLGSQGTPARVATYELIAGGFSRVMAKVVLEWPGGGTETLVMRADPPPELATLASDRSAEHRLLAALSAASTLPVPGVRWFVEDEAWFGSKALFIEYVPSRTLQAHFDAGGDPAHAAERFAELMAAVAATEPSQLGLAAPHDWHAYIDGHLARWRRIETDHVEALPIIRYLVAWLDRNRPRPLPFRLVHGDLQAANVLVADDGTWRLIDWEFSRIGDPREDLGYYNAYSGAVPPNLAALDLDGYLRRFRERTGLSEDDVNPFTFAWFTILSTTTAVEGLHHGCAGMARGERRGANVSFNTILSTVGYTNFLDAIGQLEALR